MRLAPGGELGPFLRRQSRHDPCICLGDRPVNSALGIGQITKGLFDLGRVKGFRRRDGDGFDAQPLRGLAQGPDCLLRLLDQRLQGRAATGRQRLKVRAKAVFAGKCTPEVGGIIDRAPAAGWPPTAMGMGEKCACNGACHQQIESKRNDQEPTPA